VGFTARVGSIPTSGTTPRFAGRGTEGGHQALDLRRFAARSSGTIPTSGTKFMAVATCVFSITL
jgi:hypothetical protein